MMRHFPPNKFAAWLAVVCTIIITLASWAGLPMSETLTTNLTIAWGVVALCHAIEWHATRLT